MPKTLPEDSSDHNIKTHTSAWTSVAQLVGCHPAKWKVVVWFPVRSHAWVVGLVTVGVHERGN